MFIVYAILAIIGGYLLFKNYAKIDHYLFGDINGQSEFGIINIIFATLSGSILGTATVAVSVFSRDWATEPFFVISILIIAASMAHVVYTSIIKIKGVGGIISKILYLTIISAFMYGVGFVSTFIAIIFVGFMVMSLLLGGVASSSNNKNTIRTDDGETLKESGSGLLGEKYYKDKNGDEYKSHDGGRSVTRR